LQNATAGVAELVMVRNGALAVSPLTAAQIMLLLDRFAGSHFFDTQAGGSATLWMHFFWIFGHPEVYILMIPAFGFASEIIPVFSRKAIFGYPAMSARPVAIGLVGVSVWAHICSPLEDLHQQYFLCNFDMLVGVPTGIKIFNWLGRCGEGNCVSTRPCCFASPSLFQFYDLPV